MPEPKMMSQEEVSSMITEALRKHDEDQKLERESWENNLRFKIKAEAREEAGMLGDAQEFLKEMSEVMPLVDMVVPQIIKQTAPVVKSAVAELREQFGPLFQEIEDYHIKTMSREISVAFDRASRPVLSNMLAYMRKRDEDEALREIEREKRLAALIGDILVKVINETKPDPITLPPVARPA